MVKRTPIRSKTKSSASKKRQSTLNFAPLTPSARQSTPENKNSTSDVNTPNNAIPISTPTSSSSTRMNTTFEVVILTPRRSLGSTQMPMVLDDSVDEEPIQNPPKRRLSHSATIDDNSGSDVVPTIQLLERGRESAADSDPFTPRTIRKREDAQHDDEDDDDESIITPASKRRRNLAYNVAQGKSKRALVLNEDGDLLSSTRDEPESSDDLEILPPNREENASDIWSDYELALETPTTKSRTRYAGSDKKKTPYQKRLAMLKAQREGRNTGASTKYDSDSDGEDYDEDSTESYDLNGDLNIDLEDFVVEDNPNDLLGAPDDIEIPLQFTAAAHESNSEQFQIFAQYLIRSILFPGSVSKGPRVSNAIKRLEMSASGFSDSVIQSGAWKPEFTRAMRARPKLASEDCSPEPHCDACNRNDQGCTKKIQFLGRRYNHDTLDDLSDDEGDETQDSTGEELPREETVFTLGSMCYRRTQNAHILFHWKKELKEWVQGALRAHKYIDKNGNLVNQDIEKMTDYERSEWADSVCRKMQRNIKELYEDFKHSIKSARESMAPKRWRSNAQRAFI